MRIVYVEEPYQSGYSYPLIAPIGGDFHSDFKPDLSPAEMLHLGVFGGNYFSAIPNEFPSLWFEGVELSPESPRSELNFFKVNASQPLAVWKKKGWIYEEDPLGWFLWYCRYYMGRRIPDEDERQIKRWRAMRRHVTQVQANCLPGDLLCRPRQRQALLHWAYDSRSL